MIDNLRRSAILRRKYGRRPELTIRKRTGRNSKIRADRRLFRMITIIQGVPVMIGEGSETIHVIDVLDRK